MYNRDTPPPSWYEPPDLPEEEDDPMPTPVPLLCLECEHTWTLTTVEASDEVECPECGSEDVEIN